LKKRIEHLNLVLNAIRNINRLIIIEKDTQRLIQGVCDSLTESRGYYYSWITILNKSGKFIRSAETGLGKEFLPMIEKLKNGDLPFCGNETLSRSGVIILDNPSTSCANCPLAEMFGEKTGMSVRLEHAGSIYGFLTVTISKDFAIDQEEQSLFEDIASNITYALHSIEVEEDRKHAEEALKEKTIYLDNILRSSTEMAIATTDLDLRIEYYNPMAEDFFGYTAKEVIGKTVMEVHTKEKIEPSRFERAIEIVKKEGSYKYITEQKKEENLRIISSRVSGIWNNDHELVGFTLMSQDITDRMQAEAELRESENRFRLAFDNSNMGMCLISLDRHFIRVNNQMSEIFGYSKEELENMTVDDITHPEDLDVSSKFIKQATFGEVEHAVLEKRYFHKDGSLIWGAVTISLVKDDQGNSLYFISHVQDITERKITEGKLRKSESNYRTLVDTISHGIQENDLDGTVVYCNESYAKILGYPIDEIIGKRKLWDNARTESESESMKKYIEYLKKEQPEPTTYTGQNRKLNGDIIDITIDWEYKRNEHGKLIGFISIITDITERKIAERALLQKNSEQQAIFNSFPDIYFWLKSDGTIIGYQAGQLSDLYIPPETFMEKRIQDVLPPEIGDLSQEAIDKILQGEALVSVEYTLPRPAGEKHFEARYLPLLEDQIIVVVRDVTEGKKAEAQIKASLKEKEVLLKEIHHRVKNNMAIISSSLQLQTSRIKDKDDLLLFNETRNRIQTMALIHEKLYQTQDFTKISFSKFISDLCNSLISSYGVYARQVILKVEVHDIFLDIDRAIPCGLILNELISNAFKHAFPQGKQGKLHIIFDKDTNDQFILTIHDDGVGFLEEINFRKVKSLGMKLVVALTNQLHGTINLSRKQGTTFMITFPQSN